MRVVNLLMVTMIALASHAQTWQSYLENPYNYGGSRSHGIRVIDDTIYVASSLVVFDTVYNTRAVLSKHNLATGEMLQSAQFKVDSLQNSVFTQFLFTGFNILEDTGDSLFYMSTQPWSDTSTTAAHTRFLVIDKNLNLLHDYPVEGFFGDEQQNFNGTRKDHEGNILLYGSRARFGQYFLGDSANTLLVKMTPQGEQVWKKRYDDTFTISFLTPLSDGDILFNCGWVAPSFQNAKRLIKTNSLGEEQWRMTFGGMYSTNHSAVLETSSGKILAANSWNVTNSSEQGVGWWYDNWIQLQLIEDLGTGYEIVEDVKYAYAKNTCDVYGVEEMLNGNILSWGIIADTSGSVYDPISVTVDRPIVRGFLFMLNSELDSLWMRTYYHLADEATNDWRNTYRITDVAPLESGGFVTCGWGQIDSLNDFENSWLMRLDEHGCLEPGCHTVAVDEIVVGFEKSMLVFPNPVRDFCTLAWSLEEGRTIEKNFNSTELIITDTQGREVYRSPIPNFGQNYQMQLDVSSFSSGLYYAHWVSGSTWLDTVSIVVE
jgi:hypothetical protein